jgi:hypothetical protein
MIIINSLNYTVMCDGMLEDYSSKLSRIVTEATNGSKDETYTRVVDEYDIIVSEMSDTNYKTLKNMYKFENSFTIKDTRRGIEDGMFFIDMDTLKLASQEDKKNKTFIYNGSIPIRKV